jgi:hypothetical protein
MVLMRLTSLTRERRVPGYLEAHESTGEDSRWLEQLKRKLEASISSVLGKLGKSSLKLQSRLLSLHDVRISSARLFPG